MWSRSKDQLPQALQAVGARTSTGPCRVVPVRIRNGVRSAPAAPLPTLDHPIRQHPLEGLLAQVWPLPDVMDSGVLAVAGNPGKPCAERAREAG